jgi:hypothetical protein
MLEVLLGPFQNLVEILGILVGLLGRMVELNGSDSINGTCASMIIIKETRKKNKSSSVA